MKPIEVLRQSNFGQRVAEEEMADLVSYFVQTEQWRKVFSGEVDAIYGPKGSGKSAIYLLMNEKQLEFFDRGIVLVAAEEPRGQPVFRTVEDDPPTSENEFQSLWKLYFATLVDSCLTDYKIENKPAQELHSVLADAGLIAPGRGLAQLLRNARAYVSSYFRPPSSLEGGVEIDPVTRMPTGFTGKITFSEPSMEHAELTSVNKLLKLGHDALKVGGIAVWLVLDRLDVAFADNTELEKNALRALFRVYLDMRDLPAITPKVFLRTDIWKRITDEGFREASHITSTVTIRWDRKTLLNLIVNRLLKNSAIYQYYQVEPDEISASMALQEKFFYRVFPRQVDVGQNKPESLDWMITRTMDGTKLPAPRELIHLLNVTRDNQVQRLELGAAELDGEALFSSQAILDALPEVSKTRLEQTVFAEYARLREHIEMLRGEQTLQKVETLQQIWKIDSAETLDKANQLIEIGFFEQRGTRGDPQFWVPFVYRDAAGMVQGTATTDE